MDGHSRSGAFGEEGARESDDPFDRMRSFGGLGRGADMFSHSGWSGFAHGGAGDSWSMDDPMDGMESLRQRPRPKFSSASTMMGPRPFRRERRASAGPAEPPQPAEGAAQQPGRERIIPIQVERDEADSGPAAAPQPVPQQPSPRQQRPYVRRGTMDTPVSALQSEELQRDARAHSAPPEAEPAASPRVPPLNVQAAAAAATPHKPNYFNSSPKPFSTQQRPLHTPSFGQQGQIPIPVQVERGPEQPPHQHHHQQPQQQPQQQPRQQPEEPKQPPPPPPKPKSPKERAMETIGAVQDRVAELGAEVEAFSGQRGEKQHLYLDEMLTRELLKLDNVEANGDDEIRTTRKQTIMSIQKCLAQLETKLATPAEVAAKEAQATEMEADVTAEGEEAPMETVESQPVAEAVTEEAAAAQEVEMKPAEEVAQPAAAVPQETTGAPPQAPVPAEETAAPAQSQPTDCRTENGVTPAAAASEMTPVPAAATEESLPAAVPENSAVGPDNSVPAAVPVSQAGSASEAPVPPEASQS